MKIGLFSGGTTLKERKKPDLGDMGKNVFTEKNVSRRNAVQQKNKKNGRAFSTKPIAMMARTILGTL